MQESRIEKLENALQPLGPPDEELLTIDVAYELTVVDPLTDERSQVPIPAKYDPDVPFHNVGDGTRRKMRLRYPLKETGD